MKEILRIFDNYDSRMRPYLGQRLNVTGSVEFILRKISRLKKIMQLKKSEYLCRINIKTKSGGHALRYGCIFQTILE